MPILLDVRYKDADGLIVGTPTHWGNMSAQLKLLFDRNVPVFMGEKPNGFPTSPALVLGQHLRIKAI